MCNEVARRIALDIIREDFSQLRIPLRFPEGLPNLGDAPSVRITDRTPIVRSGADSAELVVRRWSWAGVRGKPVYNYRSEGRSFEQGRCLIPVDSFFEFTIPEDPRAKRKDKWVFTHNRDRWFCIAGVTRSASDHEEAFAMLTTDPGLDVVGYHHRQVVVVERCDWGAWLDGSAAAARICRPLPANTLTARQYNENETQEQR